jgi:hypothetical protein
LGFVISLDAGITSLINAAMAVAIKNEKIEVNVVKIGLRRKTIIY